MMERKSFFVQLLIAALVPAASAVIYIHSSVATLNVRVDALEKSVTEIVAEHKALTVETERTRIGVEHLKEQLALLRHDMQQMVSQMGLFEPAVASKEVLAPAAGPLKAARKR